MGSGPELPDSRIWRTQGTPLEAVEERLRRRGLRDPWARNEAWRFSGGFAKPIAFSDIFFRGFKWGFAAFVVALGVEYALFSPKKNGGHH
ncbi:NADH dehydrogenase [ubiquinone] 1 beta subcomplex subunit 3-like [Cetorhinus maximus]